jgi:hypothetical protein
VEHTRYNSSRKRRQLKQPATIVNPTEGPEAFARERWRRNYSEAARQVFFSSKTPTSQRMIFDSARKYEDTGPEKVGRDAARRHAHQSDPSEKLAREVDQPPTCNNGLVPHQKEHRDYTVAVRKVPHGASYENALKGDL